MGTGELQADFAIRTGLKVVELVDQFLVEMNPNHLYQDSLFLRHGVAGPNPGS